MNAITQFAYTSSQLAVIKQSVAKECNGEEFNLFMEAARSYGLDPFRRQIIPLVFNKDAKDQSRRRMSIVVSRDGLRVVAQRCGNYRPASEPAEIIYDEDLKGPTNPKGIVMARVYLWQQDKRGDWFKVVGEAMWDEFAPLSYPADAWEWHDTGEVYEDSGKSKKAKRLKPGALQVLDGSGNWPKMPVVMITKCAEAQALRAGWPEQFGGIYAEEEMDRAKVIDATATEIVEAEREEQRMRAIGANDSIVVTWGDNWQLDSVPVGQFFDRAAEFVQQEEPAQVSRWASANQVGLRQFWAKHPSDALELKKLIEGKTAPVAA
ncbi:phage recombination protein Bet [Paradevosia shaoguanensis]|uniref:phage recombination protein Bet n=1 Tax=Paradevosia shaoguanensis TaxID=1335043 RepID=UPI0019329125|nr:phage recombination protein Bet [Paradevosia shaoguanensis]